MGLDKIKCYGCGTEAAPGFFVETRWQGAPTPGATIQFWCPQCSCGTPKLGLIHVWDPHDKAPWPLPKWEVVESSEGIRIRAHHEKGGSSSNTMVPGHQLEGAPASILREGLKGTLRDYSKVLHADGRARSAAFRAEYEAWDAANTEPPLNTSAHIDWQDTRRAAVDKARKDNGVGPHYPEATHDGPTLMRKAEVARVKARQGFNTIDAA